MHEISDVERAVNLRVAGVSYTDIADRLGVDVIEAEDMVAGYLSAMSSESPDIRIRLELSRLDSLLKAIWKQAVRGDSTAVGQALKITGQRATLLSKLGGDPLSQSVDEIARSTTSDDLAAIRHEILGGGDL